MDTQHLEDAIDRYETLQVSVDGKVGRIVLNRPDALNAMNQAFWNELPAAVRALDAEHCVRAIVISSTGRHFSAGMDLSVFAADGAVSGGASDRYLEAERFRSNIRQIQSSFNAVEESRVPVIAVCQGGVIGGAMDLIAACCIRVCTEDAFFCIQETNIAMVADVGTFPRLQRYIPEGWVKQMAYTGERLPAARAKEIGLVNDVFASQDAALNHALQLAQAIAGKDPLAVTGCKALIHYGRDHSVADTLDYVGVWNAGMMPHAHMKEAFTAMAEKREVDFPDLLPLRDTPM